MITMTRIDGTIHVLRGRALLAFGFRTQLEAATWLEHVS